ncbi:hypothetical protein HHI36_018517 [Cryptolaemus montrouzieri]|uniref:Uncharacterized protein n=1 Tax=Cryptolaemus montrouzieri TaxID=559131 RepID=A0ABD2P060_9CUCU
MMVNYDQLRDKLRNEKWNDNHNYDTESASKYFIEKLQGCIRSCTKKIRIKKQNSKRREWMTDAFLRSICTKMNCTGDCRGVELKMEYRNKLTLLIKTRKHLRGEIVKNGGNSKGLWKCV